MNTRKKKRKRKPNYYVVRISDNPKMATQSRRMTYGSRRFWMIVIGLIVVVLLAFIAVVNYNGQLSAGREAAYKATIEQLQNENIELQAQNDLLNDKVAILSETVNQKNVVVQAIEERSLPTGFPLSTAADLHEKDEELELDGTVVKRPMVEFIAPEGTYVLAAGDGRVSYVSEEITYGWEVVIDHGNGYKTSYRTSSEPKVRAGDDMVRGSIIFELSSDDDDPPTMAYQMIMDDEYINPTEVLEING